MAVLAQHTVQAIANIISRETNVPPEILRELARQESSFDPLKVGRAGEIGLTQIFLSTAREVGFTGRRAGLFEPVENMRRGGRYLAKQYARFGDWSLALGAYNAGPENILRGFRGNFSSYVFPILKRAGQGAAKGLGLFAAIAFASWAFQRRGAR